MQITMLIGESGEQTCTSVGTHHMRELVERGFDNGCLRACDVSVKHVDAVTSVNREVGVRIDSYVAQEKRSGDSNGCGHFVGQATHRGLAARG